MNLTKTNLRNKMQYELLESLLRIITYLNINNICCKSFTPTEEMIKLFNAKTLYDISDSPSDDDSEVYMLFKD